MVVYRELLIRRFELRINGTCSIYIDHSSDKLVVLNFVLNAA
jgi:hypothetical protein